MNKPTAIISSTVRDLPEYRDEVMHGCLRLDVFPKMMEHLPALDADAIAASLTLVDQADLYIGIFAHRYGYVPAENNPRQISITEMEYERAVTRNIPRLIFLIDENHPVKPADFDKGASAEKLDAFKRRLNTERVRDTFTTKEDLRGKLIHALGEVQKTKQPGEKTVPNFHPPNLIPHPPEPYIAHPYSLLQTKDVVGRQAELNLLTDWVTTNNLVPADTRIFNLVAIGGMGKSALTWKWFNDIAPNEMPHLAGRLWWSFYESDAHWENFLIRALAYVSRQSEEAVRKLPYPDREAQLLRILDQQPFLICLDGLERILLAYARIDAAQLPDDDLDDQTAHHLGSAAVPAAPFGVPPNGSERDRTAPSAVPPGASSSTHPPAAAKHRLRLTADHRGGQFLKRLTRVKSSRILISTRLYPADLQAGTGDPLPGCFAPALIGLSDSDALNLWREFQITGSTEQLQPIFRSFGNYPLLVRALAGEIANFRPAPRDFDKWKTAHPDFNPTNLPLINAKTHVLEYALRGLGEKHSQVLHTISAFRMPATWDTLHALLVLVRAGGPLPARFTDKITQTSQSIERIDPDSTTASPPKPCATDRELDSILTELEDRGLVGWDKTCNRYDLHPVIKSTIWHSMPSEARLTLLQSRKEFFEAIPKAGIPEWQAISTWEELTPAIELFHSLMDLQRFDEACDVYAKHISNLSLYRLGATRQQMQLLERFFVNGTQSPPSLSSLRSQTFVISSLAQMRHLIGQPLSSLPLFNLAVRLHLEGNDLKPLPNAFANIAEVSFKLGQFRASEIAGKQAILSARKWHYFDVIGTEMLGMVLSARNIKKTSQIAYARAIKTWHAQSIDERTRLGSDQGIGYVHSLLAQHSIWQNRLDHANRYAKAAWNLAHSLKFERDIVRAARLVGTVALKMGETSRALDRLGYALSRARAIYLFEEEIPIVIALACASSKERSYSRARDHLDEIWIPSERGPYPLLQADAFNLLAEICKCENDREGAIAAATKAFAAAWCDGPPYSYHYGLTNARHHLRELGAPEPQLPPFDPSKFDPMPEVDINPKDDFWVDPSKLDLL